MSCALEFLTILLPLLYGLLTAGYAAVFFRDRPQLVRILTPALTVTIILHIVYVVIRTVRYEHIPLATVFESLTMISLALVLVYWITERIVKTPNTGNTGIFVIAVAFVFQTVSALFIDHDIVVNPIFRSPLFSVHTTTAIIGYTAFALSAIYGVLYLLLHYELKVNRFGIVYSRLPSLDTLASMHEGAAVVGVISFTVAIVIGIAWLPATAFGWALGDPKVLLTIAIWLLYLAVLISYRFGWGSRIRLIYLTLFGFILLVFSTVAVNMWLQSFHVFT